MVYVMDTHVLIWYFIGSKRLKRELEEVMRTKIPEIHDRIIVATARFYKAGILTKDRIIFDSGEVEII